jgi:hypothetical protein
MDSDLSDPSENHDLSSKKINNRDKLKILKDIWSSKEMDSHDRNQTNNASFFVKGSSIEKKTHINPKGIIYSDASKGNVFLTLGNVSANEGDNFIVKDISKLGKESKEIYKTYIIVENSISYITLESNCGLENMCIVPSNGSSVELRYIKKKEKYMWIILQAMYTPSKYYFSPPILTNVEKKQEHSIPPTTKHKIKLISNDVYEEIAKKPFAHPNSSHYT